MNLNASVKLRFGNFELAPRERLLTRRGKPVELAGQPLDLLILLVEKAPDLVSRDEIRRRLWPNRVIEFESGVNSSIRDIRRALGDTANQPRFVKTVPRHGYRFIETVTAAGKGPGRRWPAVVAVTALLLAAALAWQFNFGDNGGNKQPLPEARAAFVLGEQLLASHDSDDARRAVHHFKNATQIDPDYAPGWAALADAFFFGTGRPERTMSEAESAVKRALALDPTLARAHRRLADLQFFWHWDARAAQASFRKALELDPGDAATYHAYAAYLMAIGRSDEALELMDRALAIDPLSLVMHGDLAWFHAMDGRHEQALIECETLRQLAPEARRAIACPLRSLITLGRLEEAVAIAERLSERRNLGPGSPTQRLTRYWQSRLDDLTDADQAGRRVEPMSVALLHARLGNPIGALDWIEKAREQRSRLFPFVRLYPEFRALHGIERFARIAPAFQPGS